MQYTSEQKSILRQEKFDSFANGYRRGCCWSIAFGGFFLFLSLSMCSNKPIENINQLKTKPVLVKKGDITPQKEQRHHSR